MEMTIFYMFYYIFYLIRSLCKDCPFFPPRVDTCLHHLLAPGALHLKKVLMYVLKNRKKSPVQDQVIFYGKGIDRFQKIRMYLPFGL